MDSACDNLGKRRKLEDGTAQRSQTYDSENDSGDDIFDDFETVATVPLPANATRRQVSTDILSSPPAHVTQPTQLVPNLPQVHENTTTTQSQIQVPASSPVPIPAESTKLPPAAASKSSIVLNFSDDDFPIYNGSSDEDSQIHRKADIKPSTFVATSPKPSAWRSFKKKKDEERFREITLNSFYSPSDKAGISKPKSSVLSGSVFDSRNRDDNQTTSHLVAPKRSGDIMANAYGGSSRHCTQRPRQLGPAKALPVPEPDLDIDDVEDFQLRGKIKRIRDVLPEKSVRACKRALEIKRLNFDDAMDFLVSEEKEPVKVDLTVSDSEDPLASQSSALKKAPMTKGPAKQQVKIKQNIQEKWTATQLMNSNPQPPSPPEAAPSIATPAKPRRRLVHGRKQLSSPVTVLTPPPKQHSPIRVASPARSVSFDSDETDSGVGSDKDDTELEDRVLHFFNTCNIFDLADIATIPFETAKFMLSQRPFQSLEDVRQVCSEAPAKTTTKKPSKPKPIGIKIVDTCFEMLNGYEAVDKLVKCCDEISRPLKEDMKRWGVDVFGGSTELDLVSFSRDASPRDSGIGTPSSITVSDVEEGDIRKADRKRGFFPQPPNMPASIQLKDYQVVGINWLNLLFDRKLSCILADDMGLGKTCQVIAFFAHLLDKGVKGPHLIIVPGSTLENWLREFSVFCPQLHVMPYYAKQNERPGIQDQILDSRETVNVVITTYTLAKNKDDNRFLRKLRPVVCVYDEGHLLKNSKSQGYDAYMRIPSQFRLLLTGTPPL